MVWLERLDCEKYLINPSERIATPKFQGTNKISAWKFNKQDISTSHNFLSKILGYWGQKIRGNWRSLQLKKVAFSLHPGLTNSPGKMMVGRQSFPIGRSYVTLRFGKIDWNKNPKKSSGNGGLIVSELPWDSNPSKKSPTKQIQEASRIP